MLFGILTSFRNFLYNFGVLKTYSINIPVISIGNITVGGTGKTPTTRYLAEKIISMGYLPGIISRGYGRSTKSQIIVHDGKKMLSSWCDSGDEPFLLASWLDSVPVVVDNNRVAAAKTLIKKFNVDIIILDDGFQHRKIFRNIDIVLFNSLEESNSLNMLPLGRLREKLHNLSRCDILIFTKLKNQTLNDIKNSFNLILPDKVLSSSNNLKVIKYNYNEKIEPSSIELPVFAFCGIGDPDSFIKDLKSIGIKTTHFKQFKDHEAYSNHRLKPLLNNIKTLNINSVLTTEKDALKLPDWFIKEINLFILQMEVVFPPRQEKVLLDSVRSILL